MGLPRTVVSVFMFAAPLAAQSALELRDVPRWRGRVSHSLALDPIRGRVVLFGDGFWTENRDPVWEWDGSRWHFIEPSGLKPSPRWGAAMAFDPITRRILLFGGFDGRFTLFDETWSWDGREWTLHSPTARPQARLGHAMVTDEVRGHVVLFGGTPRVPFPCGPGMNDTWRWDGSTWVQEHVAVSPPPRQSHGMAFDQHVGHIVAYGGVDCALLRGDTWSWNGQTWQLLRAASVSLSPRAGVGIATEPGTGRPLLYGGNLGNNTRPNDTWRWSGSDWQLVVGEPPKPHDQGVLVSDGRKVILFGGRPYTNLSLTDTWSWDGTSWSVAHDPGYFGEGEGYHHICFHNRLSTFVVTGASSPGTPQIFCQIGLDRELRHLSPSPPEGFISSLGYDVARDQLIAFILPFRRPATWGGWSWDGMSWTRLPDPPADVGTSSWWDPSRKRLVFTGRMPDTQHRVLLDWDGIAWTTQPFDGGPTALDEVVYGYDPVRRRIVAYGGYYGSTTSNHTWEYDGTTWSLIHANSFPTLRAGRMVYWPQRSVMVMVCGRDRDVYAWDGTQWSVLASGLLPVPYGARRVVIDPMRSRLVIHYATVFPGEPSLAEISLVPLRADQRYPRIGETVTLSTEIAHEAGHGLLVGLSTSLTPGIPVRPNASGSWDLFPLANTPLLHSSIQATALDAQGRGSVRFTIPPMPSLRGLHLYGAGVVVRPGPVLGTITNSADMWIVR